MYDFKSFFYPTRSEESKFPGNNFWHKIDGNNYVRLTKS